MEKFFKKRLTALALGLMALGIASCEDPASFDIADYTLTLSVQDGYLAQEGEDVTYPLLTVLIDGPSANLWEVTIQSQDGEEISFFSHTGIEAEADLNLKVFEEGETSQKLTVTAVENNHRQLLDRQTITARMLPARLEKVAFSLARDITKATVVDASTLNTSGFYVSATTGEPEHEAEVWTNVQFTKSGNVFTAEKWWPSTDPSYHFYASNAPLHFTAYGQTITCFNTEDVVCAYLETPDYNTANTLTFEHVLARVGTVTINGPAGYEVSDLNVSFKPKVYGSMNVRTSHWMMSSNGDPTSLSLTENNDLWTIPGTFSFTITYTLTKGDYTKSFTKNSIITLQPGKTNNLTGTLPAGDAVDVNFDVEVTAWDSIDHAITIQ